MSEVAWSNVMSGAPGDEEGTDACPVPVTVCLPGSVNADRAGRLQRSPPLALRSLRVVAAELHHDERSGTVFCSFGEDLGGDVACFAIQPVGTGPDDQLAG